MEDTFGSVDNLSNILPSDVVNPSSRSNKDKKKNGFSDALKEKMKEKQEKKKHDQDELIIDEEHKEHIQPLENKSNDSSDREQTDNSSEEDTDPLEHIDLEA